MLFLWLALSDWHANIKFNRRIHASVQNTCNRQTYETLVISCYSVTKTWQHGFLPSNEEYGYALFLLQIWHIQHVHISYYYRYQEPLIFQWWKKNQRRVNFTAWIPENLPTSCVCCLLFFRLLTESDAIPWFRATVWRQFSLNSW